MQQTTLAGFGHAKAGETHRLFFALWPDDEIRAAIAARSDRLKQDHAAGGRWIKPHRYHLTLHYLGEFPRRPTELIDLAAAAGDRVRATAFDFSLDVAGSFSNRSIPWWLGCRETPADFEALGSAISESLGVRASQSANAAKLVPHVTILRDATRALEPTPVQPIEWPVGEFVLIESVLGTTSRYDIVRRWNLRD